MALFGNTIVSSLNARRQLLNSGAALNTSFERLSSGFRINRAADDVAELQISYRLSKQVQSLNQAVRNTNGPISLTQLAVGALGEVSLPLQYTRQLALHSQNAINSSADRAALQNRFQLPIRNSSLISANIAGARSRIRDKNLLWKLQI
ncbi:MAG: flagellin [Paraglaciecola sp.]|jgi:flagellin